MVRKMRQWTGQRAASLFSKSWRSTIRERQASDEVKEGSWCVLWLLLTASLLIPNTPGLTAWYGLTDGRVNSLPRYHKAPSRDCDTPL